MARSNVECTVMFEMEDKTTEVLKCEKKKYIYIYINMSPVLVGTYLY